MGPGGSIAVGSLNLKVAGIIADEPDRLGEGFTLGPVVIVAADVPARAGLTAPGAMYRSKYRIALPAGRDPQAVADRLKAKFPSAGFELRTRDKAAPGAERFVSRMGDFLVLVGLAALAIAGIGIGGGVASYLEARRTSVATLKVLGATSGDIARVYLLQVGAAALVGSAFGLVAGVLVTPLLAAALGSLLPVSPGLVFDPGALARAALYGLLIALVFAAPPLLAARRFPAMALLRARVTPLRQTWRDATLPVGLGMSAIAALALLTTKAKLVTAWFLGGALILLLLLGALGWAIRWLAAHAPRPKAPLLRIALANLHRPGAQTGALVTALGFGLAAFVSLAAIQTSLDANIMARVPQRAPDYFVLDVPKERAGAFQAAVAKVAPQAKVRMVPALRGAILAYGPESAMIRVADLKEIPEEAWPLRGERGLTYSDTVPEGNSVSKGQWWPAQYRGEPLVSIDEKLELRLWSELGLAPKSGRDPWYFSAGSGMGEVLMLSNSKQAYTLSDRATYAAFQNKIDLAIVVEGDAKLFNPYGVIAVNPAKSANINHQGAMRFIEWLTSSEGQKRIADFRVMGLQMFFPSASAATGLTK